MKIRYILLCICVSCSAMLGADPWVADPFRSVETVWKKHPFMGREFWLLLNPAWLTLKGLQDQKFVRESGTSHVQTLVTLKNGALLRTLILREIELKSASGKTLKGKVTVSAPGEKIVFQHPEHLFDGKRQTASVLSASILDIRKRYTSFTAEMQISSEEPFQALQIHHGSRDGGRVRFVRIPLLPDSAIRKQNDFIRVTLPGKPVRKLTLTLESELPVYSIQRVRIYPKERGRLKKYPFYVEPPFRFALSSLLGLRKENIDRASFEKIRKEFPESFMGFRLAEWDSNFLQTLIRPSSDRFKDLSAFITVPCTKEGLLKNFQTYWKLHTDLLGDQVYGLSGQVNFMHMGCDFGSRIAGVELTQEHKEHPHRNTLMYVRGASRQFGVPMLVYTAYYATNCAPDSRIRRKNARFGLDYGMPPSLGLRNYYISYYMGNNFLDFESQPYGQAVRNKQGSYELTENGKAIREIFEWTRKPEGKRGECYTPFLLLADRKHGNDMWVRLFDYWGTWYSLFPAQDSHYMTEYFMQAVNPRYDVRSFDDPMTSGNLRNSTLGDLFDLYVANPLRKKSVSLQQLEKYAVVFLIDDLAMTEELVHTLKQYTARGGTLVLSTGQAEYFSADREFLPTAISRKTLTRDQLKIHVLTPAKNNGKILMKTTDRLPLAVRSSYGNGHVILTSSPFWRTMKNRLRAPGQLITMLEKIQKEVLPLKIKGDCQFLINIMPDKTWKVILVNNRGIVKRPAESKEILHKKFTSSVTLTLPPGTRVREVRKGAKPIVRKNKDNMEYTFTLPPAEILVVDCKPIRDLPRRDLSKTFNVKKSPLPHKKQPSVLAFDGYRKRHLPRKGVQAPPDQPLIGRWNVGDKGLDSSGNGNHLKLVSVRTDGKSFSMTDRRSHGSVTVPIPYDLPGSTWTVWAKPQGKNLSRGTLLYTKQMSIEYCNGNWQLILLDLNKRQICKGPKVQSRWTHLTVTCQDGFCHFYIDGKEVFRPEGPLKYAAVPGKNSFYNKLFLTVGANAPHFANMYPFQGLIGDITLYNKALTPSQIRSKASERVSRKGPGIK